MSRYGHSGGMLDTLRERDNNIPLARQHYQRAIEEAKKQQPGLVPKTILRLEQKEAKRLPLRPTTQAEYDAYQFCDLSGLVLPPGLNFDNYNLQGSNFSGVLAVTLRHSSSGYGGSHRYVFSLRFSNCTSAFFVNTTFKNVNMQFIQLDRANLLRASFQDCALFGASFYTVKNLHSVADFPEHYGKMATWMSEQEAPENPLALLSDYYIDHLNHNASWFSQTKNCATIKMCMGMDKQPKVKPEEALTSLAQCLNKGDLKSQLYLCLGVIAGTQKIDISSFCEKAERSNNINRFLEYLKENMPGLASLKTAQRAESATGSEAKLSTNRHTIAAKNKQAQPHDDSRTPPTATVPTSIQGTSKS